MTPSLSPEALAKGLTKEAERIAASLKPLDRDGMAIMADPPESFPVFLVLRLCKPGNLIGAPRNWRSISKYSELRRPPLVEERDGKYRYTDLGRAVARALMAGKGDE